jgi:hypothetical protein
VAGNFFAGELFVDKDKKAFAKLGFKRFSILSILSAIFTRKAREATAKAKVSLPCVFSLAGHQCCGYETEIRVSVTLLTPGSGSGMKSKSETGIRDPGSGVNISVTIFWVKNT